MQLIEVLLNINYSDAPAWAHLPLRAPRATKKITAEKAFASRSVTDAKQYLPSPIQKDAGREWENGMNGIMGVGVGDSCSSSPEQHNVGLRSNFVGDSTRFKQTSKKNHHTQFPNPNPVIIEVMSFSLPRQTTLIWTPGEVESHQQH